MPDPLFVRKVAQEKWLHPDHPWWPLHEAPADVLADLKTDSGDLSVYEIESPQDSRVFDIALALSMKTDRPGNVDFVTVRRETIVNLGLNAEKTTGDTPSPVVNEWHWHIKGLTAILLARLATELHQAVSATTLLRVKKKDIERSLLAGIKAQEIRETDLSRRMVQYFHEKQLVTCRGTKPRCSCG